MLFSFFIGHQYVASRCVLGNFDLESCRTVVYNSRIETNIGVYALLVNKIKNIFTLIS